MSPRDLALGLLVSLIWGGNFIFAKLGVMQLPPFLFAGVRFVIVAILLSPWLRVPREGLRDLAALVVIMGLGHFGLIFLGLSTSLELSSVIIVGQIGVPLSVALGILMLGERPSRHHIAGLVCAFVGIVLVAGAPNSLENVPGLLLILGASFMWALGNVWSKRLLGIHPFTIVGSIALGAAPMLLILSMTFEGSPLAHLGQMSRVGYVALLYNALLSSITAYALWYSLLRRWQVSSLVVFSLLQPIFGVWFATLVFGEPLTAVRLAGGAFVLLGVFWCVRSERARSNATSPSQ